MKRKICLALYYGFAIFLSESSKFFAIGGSIRRMLCKRIFSKCGKNVNIEKGARFGDGKEIEIGDYSGIGINCTIPRNAQIGSHVMMAPNVFIFNRNHEYKDTTIPMRLQGSTAPKKVVIEDDVWIGQNVLITPGRTIKTGTIIAAGCVLCKDFPEYSIVGGNPSRLIKTRK